MGFALNSNQLSVQHANKWVQNASAHLNNIMDNEIVAKGPSALASSAKFVFKQDNPVIKVSHAAIGTLLSNSA